MPRTPREFNWNEIEEKLECGCSASEIYSTLCDRDTFYKKIRERYGKPFPEISAEFRSKGHSIIRHLQYQKAKEGSIKMLEFLGRIWLGQEQQELKPINDEINSLKHQNFLLMSEIMKLREEKDGKLPSSYENQPKASKEFCGSDSSVQHMGGSGELREDLCEH